MNPNNISLTILIINSILLIILILNQNETTKDPINNETKLNSITLIEQITGIGITLEFILLIILLK